MHNLTQCPDKSQVFLATVSVLFSVIVLLGFFGNLLVITVIVANNHMRNTTNILITSLAVADLLFIIFCVPLTALFYIVGWVFGEAACVLFQYFTFVPVYGSVYTLVLMSADRYLAVVHPIRSIGLRNQRNTLIAVALTWVLIGACHVPFAMDVGIVTVGDCAVGNCSAGECRVHTVTACANSRFLVAGGFSPQGKFFYSCFGLLGYLLPYLVIITLYALLVRKLMCGRAAGISQSGEAARSKRRVTRMVVIVIVIFGTCWLPIHLVFALQMWYKDFEDAWFRYLQAASQMLAYMNSCVNPIIYAFLSENFRQAFAKFLGITLKAKVRRDCDSRALRTGVGVNGGKAATAATAAAAAAAAAEGVNEDDNDADDEDAEAAGGNDEEEEMRPLRTTLELSAQVHRDYRDA